MKVSEMAKNNIDELVKSVIESMGYEYIGAIQTMQGRFSVLRIYIDKTGGVTADDCGKVSHQVSAILEVEEPISGHYHLEISSPGFDRPLFGLEDFKKFTGKRVQIQLSKPLDNRRNFTGSIGSVEQETVTLQCDGEIFLLPIEQISKANLVPEL